MDDIEMLLIGGAAIYLLSKPGVTQLLSDANTLVDNSSNAASWIFEHSNPLVNPAYVGDAGLFSSKFWSDLFSGNWNSVDTDVKSWLK